MFASSIENMQKCYERYVCGDYLQNKQEITVLDIGGANVHGSFSDIFSQEKFNYTAANFSASEGVDVVLEDPYHLPFVNSSIDILISGYMLEHVEFFWRLFEEMVRVLKDDGWIFLIAPSSGPIYGDQIDCYRFYPDAYRALAKYTDIQLINVFRDLRGPGQDLVGIFSKNQAINNPENSKWRPLTEKENNRFLEERLPATTNITPQPKEVEKTQGTTLYLDVLRSLHQKLKPSNYIEIGVRRGKSLSLAQCHNIAIDPDADIDINNFEQTEFFEMPSDHFFEYHSDKLKEQSFDLAFIDGMHLFEFVLRDFINIEACSNQNSVVIIDDIFPSHEIQASRKRLSKVWTGDVWKILVCLKEFRPDLNFITLNCEPTGLLVISNLNKDNDILIKNYNSILKKYNDLPIEDYRKLIIDRSESKDSNSIQFKKFLNALVKKNKSFFSFR